MMKKKAKKAVKTKTVVSKNVSIPKSTKSNKEERNICMYKAGTQEPELMTKSESEAAMRGKKYFDSPSKC